MTGLSGGEVVFAGAARRAAGQPAVVPELNLPPRRCKPNRNFTRGELPRLVREIMGEAGAPVSVRDIAIKALARKGVTLPGPGIMKRTRTQVQQIFADWRKVRTVGRKQDKGGMLVQSEENLP